MLPPRARATVLVAALAGALTAAHTAALTGCGGSPHTGAKGAQVAPPTPVVTASSATLAPALDEVAVKARSHALFDALDRGDAPAMRAAFGPAFAMFETARFYDGARMIARAEQRDGSKPTPTRTWQDERVFLGPGVAVFIGEAIVHNPAADGQPAGDDDGWNTLVWTFDGKAWKASHWQWQKGGVEGERSMWNETFHSSIGFNHKPNQLLVDTVRGRKPGTALDLAMGQGRNAVFLAQEGWKVTGVDISDEGIAQATAAAKGARGKLETVRADLDTWDMGKGKWDLVTMIYAGSDAPMIARAQAAVKPGGLMVIEYFQAEATAGIGIGGFAKGEPASAFKAGWKLLRDEAVEDIADWGMRKTKLVRFVAEKK